MNHREASSVLALLHHLDGSAVQDPELLMIDVQAMFEAARPSNGALPLDLDVLEDTLGQVAQRFSDGWDWADERAVEDVQVDGERL